jgi:hypothetical protein
MAALHVRGGSMPDMEVTAVSGITTVSGATAATGVYLSDPRNVDQAPAGKARVPASRSVVSRTRISLPEATSTQDPPLPSE